MLYLKSTICFVLQKANVVLKAFVLNNEQVLHS